MSCYTCPFWGLRHLSDSLRCNLTYISQSFVFHRRDSSTMASAPPAALQNGGTRSNVAPVMQQPYVLHNAEPPNRRVKLVCHSIEENPIISRYSEYGSLCMLMQERSLVVPHLCKCCPLKLQMRKANVLVTS